MFKDRFMINFLHSYRYFRMISFISLIVVIGQLSIASSQELSVCGPLDHPPYSWVRDKKYFGVFKDILNKYADSKSIKINYIIPTSWAECNLMLKFGKVDLIFATFKSHSKKKYSIFSKTLFKSDLFIITYRNRIVSNEHDYLSRQRIGLQNGSYYGSKLDDVLEKKNPSKTYFYNSYSDIITMLKNNQIDYTIGDNLHIDLLLYKLKSNNMLNSKTLITKVGKVFDKQDFHYAFSKNSNFAKFDKVIGEFNNYLEIQKNKQRIGSLIKVNSIIYKTQSIIKSTKKK